MHSTTSPVDLRRRKILSLSLMAPLAAGSLLVAPEAWANPFLRFLFGGLGRAAVRGAGGALVRGTVARGVARAAVTRQVLTIRTASQSMVRAKTALGTALLLTPFMGGEAQTGSVGAEATWVQAGVDNEVTVSLVNFSDEPIMTNLDLVVQDYKSRNVDWIERIGVLQMAPRAQMEFTFKVRDLPKAGLKKVVAQTGYAGIYGESGKILVVRQEDTKGYAANGSHYRINGKSVKIRQGPGEKYPQVRKPLPFGTPVKLVKTDGTWIKVDVLEDGETKPLASGWVLGKYVKSPQG